MEILLYVLMMLAVLNCAMKISLWPFWARLAFTLSLGIFAYCLLTKRGVHDKVVPYIAVVSPLLCFAADEWTKAFTDYRFGYELLMVNGALTFLGLWCSKYLVRKTA